MILFITNTENNEIYPDTSVYHVRPELRKKAEQRIKFLIENCKNFENIEEILESKKIAYDSSNIDVTISVGLQTRKKHVLGVRILKKSNSIMYKMISQSVDNYDLIPLVVFDDE